MKHKKLVIGASIVVALVVVALLTVLNKKWWARRTFLKWKEAPDPQLITDVLYKNTPLWSFITDYFNGHEGWQVRKPGSSVEVTDDVPPDEQSTD